MMQKRRVYKNEDDDKCKEFFYDNVLKITNAGKLLNLSDILFYT